MSDSYENSSLSWDDQTWALLESAIERLEAYWRRGEVPDLSKVVPVGSDDPRHDQMLARLIIVDQECRSIAGCPRPLEKYLLEYSQLSGRPELFELADDSQAEQKVDASKETLLWKSSRNEFSEANAAEGSWALRVLCPQCRLHIQVLDEVAPEELCCPDCEHRFSLLQGGVPIEEAEAGVHRLKRTIAHFHLLEQLGMGAFGSVWKARDTDLDRIVAIKIPRGDRLNPEEVERFFREARAAAQFRHPNLVGVQAVGREGNQLYIVSDFIEGLPLDAWRGEQQLEFRQTAELVHKIASAIQAAHDGGVIHRDLKPQNILIDSDDEPCIVDFGMAKRHLEAELTSDGQTLGTPLYMSPEQASGGSKDVDQRSDVYAMGIILYELLAGTTPFRGSTLEVCRQHLETEPPSPRKINGQIPRDLETICLQCLEKEPDRRYQTAQELADELKRYLDGEPIKASPSSALNRAWRWSKRRPLIASLSGALFLAVVTVCLMWVFWPDKTVLVAEDFSGDTLDTELWDWNHTGEFSYQGTGQRHYECTPRHGQCNLEARARHDRGWSCVQLTWLDLQTDLKELDNDLVVDVELAARCDIGSAAMLMSNGEWPRGWQPADGVVLFAGYSDPNTPLRLDRRFLRVFLSRSQSLAVLETLSGEFDVADLSTLDKWLLRFYVSAGTSGDLPAASASLKLDSVRVSKLQEEAALLGRVMDRVANRGVEGVDLEIGGDRQLVTTNANGYFFAKTAPGTTSVRIQSDGYSQLSGSDAEVKRGTIASMEVCVKDTDIQYGDVVGSIPFEHDTVRSLVVEREWLWIDVGDSSSGDAFYRIRFDDQKATRVNSSPGMWGMSAAGNRLFGVANWPGRVFEISAEGQATEIHRFPTNSLAWPFGIAFDGRHVWLVALPEQGDDCVHVIDPGSWATVASITSRDPLTGAIAAAPDGRIWVCRESGGVYELDGRQLLRQPNTEFPATTAFSGKYKALGYGDGELWGVDNEARRLCKINIGEGGVLD